MCIMDLMLVNQQDPLVKVSLSRHIGWWVNSGSEETVMRSKWQPQTTETTPALLLQNLIEHYCELHESTTCAGFVWKLLTLFIKIYTRKPAIPGPHLCALNSFFVFRLPCEALLCWTNLWFCTGALLKASACVPRESSGLKSPSSSGVGGTHLPFNFPLAASSQSPLFLENCFVVTTLVTSYIVQ